MANAIGGRSELADIAVDASRLVWDYWEFSPDFRDAAERVSFSSSGHRGSSSGGTFNEAHVLALAQAVSDYRDDRGITGPLFLGRDTHPLSEPAAMTTLGVLAGNSIDTLIEAADTCTPAPAVSHAIVGYNRGRRVGLADGIVLASSPHAPECASFRYHPPSGGRPDWNLAKWIEKRSNELLTRFLKDVAWVEYERAVCAPTTRKYDYVRSYVDDLSSVIDMEAIRAAGITIGIDPLEGSTTAFWPAIADRYGVDVEAVDGLVDSVSQFLPAAQAEPYAPYGTCSRPQRPYRMSPIISIDSRFDVAFVNSSADRYGIITRSGALIDPARYLSAAAAYLCAHRPGWSSDAALGKSVVTTAVVDRIAAKFGRPVIELPVGFRWLREALLDGSIAFACEASGGATVLRRNGTAWSAERDGLVMTLVNAELMARTGRTASEVYEELAETLGHSWRTRTDVPASAEVRATLTALPANAVDVSALAGDRVQARLTTVPGNGAAIGGVKIVTAHGWFAVHASPDEPTYRLYAESFRNSEHLDRIEQEAQAIVKSVVA